VRATENTFNECRCNERLKTKVEGSTRLGYTGLEVEGVGVMKDKEINLEEIEVSHTRWRGGDTLVVRLFIDTQNRLVTLNSVLIKSHEETDISPHSVIYRPVGSTIQLVTKLSPPNFTVFQVHRYLESPIFSVQRRFRVKSQHPNSQSPHTSNSVQNCILSPTTT
jgi:hypothetical protein